MREEPKGIVFLSRLLLLFQHCHFCFAASPKVRVFQNGTMLTLNALCNTCNQKFTWKSQPNLLGNFPAGNLLLSFAILCAGASVNKVLLVFSPHGSICISSTNLLLSPEASFNPSNNCLLEEIPRKTSWIFEWKRGGTCRWWSSRQYGPLRQIWHLYNLLLHHRAYNWHCSSTGQQTIANLLTLNRTYDLFWQKTENIC